MTYDRYDNMHELFDFRCRVFNGIGIAIGEMAFKTHECYSRLNHAYMQYASILKVFNQLLQNTSGINHLHQF